MFTSLLGGGIFDPQGAVALAQKNLIITSVLLMLIVIIPVFILTFFFAYKYRESNKSATYTPEWSHNTKLELVWWGIPILIILALGIITWKSSHDLDPYKPLPANGKEPIVIQVVAMNWKWLFIYPKENIATLNYIKIPTNTPVVFMLTSDAPMNSFWIPQLAGQIYAMPGMETRLNVIANSNGKFEGKSANYSGYGFSGMSFIAESLPQQDYNNWVDSIKNSSTEILDNKSYIELAKFSLNNKVKTYSFFS
jgi:cytochrome o ubiquinol oxidase subunit 2